MLACCVRDVQRSEVCVSPKVSPNVSLVMQWIVRANKMMMDADPSWKEFQFCMRACLILGGCPESQGWASVPTLPDGATVFAFC